MCKPNLLARIFLLFLSLFSVQASTMVHAQAINSEPLYNRITPPASQDVITPEFVQSDSFIPGLINFLFDLFVRRMLPWLVAVMVIFIIWAGYNYIFAGGDSGKVKQAKDMILYAIIAIIIAFAAYSIITIMNDLILNYRPT